MNALSLKTKKERIRSHYPKPFSEHQIRLNLVQMCGSKNRNQIISLLKSHVLNSKKQDQFSDLNKKRQQSYFKNDMIERIQESHSNFFIPKIQVSRFQRKIDKVLSQFEITKHHQSLNEGIIEEEQTEMATIPYQSKLIQLNKQINLKSKQPKIINRSTTLPCRKPENSYNSPGTEGSNSPALLRRQSSKRTNTFVFHSHSRKIPIIKSTLNWQLPCNWQQQLLQNINIIQTTNFIKKRNAKIQKQKLSAFLKSIFVNEVITEYYRCQNSESFAFIKGIIEDLNKLSDKEIKIITFFTFDLNQDGFICENDIYHFLENLPHNSKILDDINLIVSFLKCNQLQSSETNLPQFLLKTRQKTVFNALSNQSSLSRPRINKKKKIVNSLFTIVKKSEESARQKRQVKVKSNRYKINFQVFSFIFSDNIPILISQIVKCLTNKICIFKPVEEPQSQLETITSDQFCETRSKSWMDRVYRSKQIASKAHHENEKLNIKIS